MMEGVKREYRLGPDCELRFEIELKSRKVTLELKSGLAEVFGTELVKNKRYVFFPGSNIAVFTWQGCTLELEGTPTVTYIAKETPMLIYLNCHAVLERLREASTKEDSRGPVTMIVGPCDVGKSTISRLLANYALRMGRTPIYVNIDVGQVDFAVPGTVGALLLNDDAPVSVEKGFSQEAPLVFHFGYDSPQNNDALYKLLITRLAQVCTERMKINQRAKHSGVIINTCGWTKGEGYTSLMNAAEAFEVDTILVIDYERLYNDLVRDMPDFVKVVLLPKSGGVVKRDQTQRAEAKNSSIHKYLYGMPNSPLHPYKLELKFDQVSIYKIGTTTSFLPPSVNSLSMKSGNTMTTTRLVPLQPTPHMRYHLLSVSFADSEKDDVVRSNVAGFLHVQEVNMQKKILTVLSPQPELVPNLILLLSEIKYCHYS